MNGAYWTKRLEWTGRRRWRRAAERSTSYWSDTWPTTTRWSRYSGLWWWCQAQRVQDDVLPSCLPAAGRSDNRTLHRTPARTSPYQSMFNSTTTTTTTTTTIFYYYRHHTTTTTTTTTTTSPPPLPPPEVSTTSFVFFV